MAAASGRAPGTAPCRFAYGADPARSPIRADTTKPGAGLAGSPSAGATARLATDDTTGQRQRRHCVAIGSVAARTCLRRPGFSQPWTRGVASGGQDFALDSNELDGLQNHLSREDCRPVPRAPRRRRPPNLREVRSRTNVPPAARALPALDPGSGLRRPGLRPGPALREDGHRARLPATHNKAARPRHPAQGRSAQAELHLARGGAARPGQALRDGKTRPNRHLPTRPSMTATDLAGRQTLAATALVASWRFSD
jgi:hypothetical protein